MEALGGDQKWSDRFFAQHAAVFYYWILVSMWLLSPSIAYNFSQLIEAHAVDTYGEFRDANEVKHINFIICIIIFIIFILRTPVLHFHTRSC